MGKPNSSSAEGNRGQSARAGFWAELSRIAPVEVWVLAGLGIFFHFLAQVHFEKVGDPPLLYNHQLRFLIPAAFGIAILYVYLGRLGKLRLGRISLSGTGLAEIGLGLAAVLYVKIFDPILWVDDVGFILRYLDNFRDGCFYCYNVEDGPVFGISSFIYGLLAGAISWLHLLSPEKTLSLLTYGGIFAFVVLLFRIVRNQLPSLGLSALTVIFIITLDKSVLSIFNSGMESPVHLSIVLAAMLFYQKRNHRLMWLFLALATISKLDVVPLVVVVGFLWLIENWRELMGNISYKNKLWQALLLYGALPVVLWVGFALLVFGSPLPQSAYAKVYFHNHSKGSWFPFLDRFVNSVYRAPLFWATMGLLVLHLGAVLARRRKLSEVAFGLSFVATMVLYYFYNPGERMQWYYTLPETLMMVQLGISAHWLFSWLKTTPRTLALGLAIGGTFLLLWSYEIAEIGNLRQYETVVELERKKIGEYLGERIPEGDTLMAGHGLISRHANGYVIDQTGLNSKLTTDFKRNIDSLVHTLKPDYIVMHGFFWDVNKLNSEPYVHDTAFYDITTYWYPTWRVFRKVDDMSQASATYRFKPELIDGKNIHFIEEKHKFIHAKADDYTFTRPFVNPKEDFITLGVWRQPEDINVHIRDIFPGDSLAAEYDFVVDKYYGWGSTHTQALTIPLRFSPVPDSIPEGKRVIEMTFKGNPNQVTITDPFLSIRNSL